MGDDKDDTNEFLISRSLLSSLRHREPAEILETLERATGIPYDDLRRTFCPSLSEVGKRMTWATQDNKGRRCGVFPDGNVWCGPVDCVWRRRGDHAGW
jgi:hypothetical protein